VMDGKRFASDLGGQGTTTFLSLPLRLQKQEKYSQN
jgi:hypothetical protein